MRARAVRLAKVSRPQIPDALPRERLFAYLHNARRRPVVWVSAPPGSGKTTLIASYLEAHKIGGLWYQVDRDDVDPATFCYFLGIGERQLGSRKRALPLLTPEYMSDLPRYARRFFRELFARLSRGDVLVLDNFQEVSDDGHFHAVVEAGLQEIPHGVNCIILSRVDPPPRYSRLIANQRIELLDWNAMKLTLEETRGIATLGGKARHEGTAVIDDGAIRRLHEESGGWCAGLVLLLEQAKQAEAMHYHNDTEALHRVFDYFATQLFDGLSKLNQDLLLRLAFLPRMTTAAAQAVTGSFDAGRMLESLYRRHLFTDRRETSSSRRFSQSSTRTGFPEHIYQFHALFSAFLRQRAESALTPDEIRSVRVHSGQLLRDEGQVESAFDLFCEASDYDSARELVLAEAEGLVGEGRWKSLVGWIEQLPCEVMETDPWLLHWLGIARIASEPSIARELLGRAYALALLQSNRLCAIQSVAGIVETHVLEYTNLRACDEWLPMLDAAFSEGIDFDTPEAEARVLAAFLNGLVYRDPGNANIERYVARALALFGSELNANLRTTLSVPLNYWGTNCGHLEVAAHVIGQLEPLMESTEVTDLRKGLFCYAAVHYYSYLLGNNAKVERIVRMMQELAAETGFGFIASWAAHCAGNVAARSRDVDGVKAWLKAIDDQLTDRLHDRALRSTMVAMWLGACAGDARLAREEALRSLELMERVGLVPHQFFNLSSLLWAASEIHDVNELERWVAYHARLSASTGIRLYFPCVLAAEAKTYCEIGEHARGDAALRSVMEWARGNEQRVCAPSFLMAWMRDLCELSLLRGVEVEFAREIIRENRYKPRSPDVPGWPWPIKIYSLGEFRILADDRPLSHSRKTPKRLLSLLKALIAFGATEVPVEQLVDSLWAESEGDTAHAAAAVAVRRLRALLGHEEAILLKAGQLSINPEVCWVDSLAFERSLSVESTGGGVERAIELYRGQFLRDETAAPWAFPYRQRLHAKFLLHANRFGKYLEAQQDWDTAERWYTRGLDIDDVAEAFYQGLARCHIARGDRTGALRVYERMKQLLSQLGIAPSAASNALHQSLLR